MTILARILSCGFFGSSNTWLGSHHCYCKQLARSHCCPTWRCRLQCRLLVLVHVLVWQWLEGGSSSGGGGTDNNGRFIWHRRLAKWTLRSRRCCNLLRPMHSRGSFSMVWRLRLCACCPCRKWQGQQMIVAALARVSIQQLAHMHAYQCVQIATCRYPQYHQRQP